MHCHGYLKSTQVDNEDGLYRPQNDRHRRQVYLVCISYHEFHTPSRTFVQTSSLLGNQFKFTSFLSSRDPWSEVLTYLLLWKKFFSVLCCFLCLHLESSPIFPSIYDMPHALHIRFQVATPLDHCFGLNKNSWVPGCAMGIQRGR